MKTKKWNELTARVLTSLVFASFSGSTALAALPGGYTKGTDGSYIYTSNVTSGISGEPGDKIVLGDGTTAMKVSDVNVIGGYSDTGDVTKSSVTVKDKVSLDSNDIYGGYVYVKGSGGLKAKENDISITSTVGGISTEHVSGGYAKLNIAAEGKAEVAASHSSVIPSEFMAVSCVVIKAGSSMARFPEMLSPLTTANLGYRIN